jgi:Mlc titration factor MtfA (ptsG expression regulator)
MILTTKKYKLAKKFSLLFSFLIAALGALIALALPSQDEGKIIHGIIGLLLSILLFPASYLFFMRKYRRRRRILNRPFPAEWEFILSTRIPYYSTLSSEERERFRQEMQIFLGEKRITGIDTEIDDVSRILIAASAIIPVFNFPEWEYDNLGEILVYPSSFDEEYEFSHRSGDILGLVTNYGGTMIISKPALLHGFENMDGKNVGIHEFAHKVDGADGSIDGVPALLIDKQTAAEWARIRGMETDRINRGRSEINPYALTSSAEFFAVASEYFFEDPSSLAKKHPELYEILRRIFKQDTRTRFKEAVRSIVKPSGRRLRRNDPCPCGSGKKYKRCCLNKIRD